MSVYDEIEIEDLDFDEETEIFYYPCPCGDKFQITLVNMRFIQKDNDQRWRKYRYMSQLFVDHKSHFR